MAADWLSTSSFERAQELISAINVIVIDTRYRQVNKMGRVTATDVEMARTVLRQFLRLFRRLTDEAESDKDVVVGSDPRLTKLARDFVRERRAAWMDNPLSVSFDEVDTLLDAADDEEQLSKLLAFLQGLRALIEEHSQEDIRRILGDL